MPLNGTVADSHCRGAASPCGICGGQIGTVRKVFSRVHSSNVPCTFNHLSRCYIVVAIDSFAKRRIKNAPQNRININIHTAAWHSAPHPRHEGTVHSMKQSISWVGQLAQLPQECNCLIRSLIISLVGEFSLMFQLAIYLGNNMVSW